MAHGRATVSQSCPVPRPRVWIARLALGLLVLGLVPLEREAFSHAGHSHAPAVSPSQLNGKQGGVSLTDDTSLFLNTKPVSVGLALRGGYEADPYSAILPGVAAFFGRDDLNISPGYQLRARQFVSNGDNSRDQDIDHHFWLNGSKPLGRVFGRDARFTLQTDVELYRARVENRASLDVNTFSLMPAVAFEISRKFRLQLAYSLENRRFPNGVTELSVPAASSYGQNYGAIIPKETFAAAPKGQTITGVSDLEQHACASVNYGVEGGAGVGINARGILNRSSDITREFDGLRAGASGWFGAWGGAAFQLSHKAEWRVYESRQDMLHTSEIGLLQKLSEKMALASSVNLNQLKSSEATRWREGYLEIRSKF